jgi:hypothetical protein
MFEKPTLMSFAQRRHKTPAHHVEAALADFPIIPDHRTGSGGALFQLGAMFGVGRSVMNDDPGLPIIAPCRSVSALLPSDHAPPAAG